jgi:hypothetical protein
MKHNNSKFRRIKLAVKINLITQAYGSPGLRSKKTVFLRRFKKDFCLLLISFFPVFRLGQHLLRFWPQKWLQVVTKLPPSDIENPQRPILRGEPPKENSKLKVCLESTLLEAFSRLVNSG